MNLQTVLDQVQSRTADVPAMLEEHAKTARGQARRAADGIGERYEEARESVEKGAEKAKVLTVNNLFRAYDMASRLLPMILPERAARVRSRRMMYAAIGGVVLGAGAIAVLEVRRPGTLSGMFKQARRAVARAIDDVEQRVEEGKQSLEQRVEEGKQSLEQRVEEGKQSLEQRIDATKEHAVEGARVGTERIASTVDSKIAAIPKRVESAAKDAKQELAVVKEKVLRTIDAIENDKRVARAVDGNNHRS